MKNRSSVFSTLFSSVLLLTLNFNANACAWYAPTETLRFSLFNADLFQDRGLRPMYYNLYTVGHPAVNTKKDERLLSQEWKKELRLKSSVEDIQSYFFGGLTKDKLALHTFALEIRKHKELKQFIVYAKACEFNISDLDPWSDSSYLQREKTIPKLIIQGEKLINSEKNIFWKKKYAFQLLRLCYYNDKREKFMHYYNTYFGNGRERTTLDWWATHYFAEWQENVPSARKKTEYDYEYSSHMPGSSKSPYANYLHAMVFRNSSNKAYISKRLYYADNFNQQLTFARNKEERANLYLMKQLNNPFVDLSCIDSIVKYSPNHPQLKLILTRELNKFEEAAGNLTYNVYAGETNPYINLPEMGSREKTYLLKLEAFRQQVQSLQAWKKENANQYYLFLTHLNILLHDLETAQQSLDLVSSKNKEVLFQKHVYATCIIASGQNITSVSVQNKIADELNYLVKNRKNVFESDRALFSLCSYLSKAFEGKKLRHIAGVFSYYAKTKFQNDFSFYSPFDYFDQSSDIIGAEKLLKTFNKKNKNKLEQFMYLPFENDYDFRILLSRLYLRKGQTAKASEIISNIPDVFWYGEFGRFEELESSPFMLPKEIIAVRRLPKLTRKQIMAELYLHEKGAKKGNTKDLIALGNAWFNFSSSGKNWHIMSYYYNQNPEPLPARLNEICFQRSIGYFNQLLKNKTNAETKALAHYMLALIAQERGQRSEYMKQAGKYEQLKDTEFYAGAACENTSMAMYEIENK